MLFVCGAACVK